MLTHPRYFISRCTNISQGLLLHQNIFQILTDFKGWPEHRRENSFNQFKHNSPPIKPPVLYHKKRKKKKRRLGELLPELVVEVQTCRPKITVCISSLKQNGNETV